MSKRTALEKLAQDIERMIPNHWLFPTRGKVQGFFGTGLIMFVGERPSTGNFGGGADLLLYRTLERLGAADSHLTDVIKSRGKVGEPYPEDMGPQRRIFDLEMEIIQPRKIITFGQKVHDLLQFFLAGSGVKIIQVWHYAYTRRGKAKIAEFERQMRQAIGRT
jgi:uracil-DNA glycosylase